MSTRLWKTAAIAGGFSVLAAVLLLAGAVLLLLKGEQPDRYIGLLVGVIPVVCAALSGYLAARMESRASLAAGLLAGLLYTAILCLISLPFGDGFTMTGLLCRGVMPVAVSAGTGCITGSRGTTRYGNRRKAAKHAGKIYKGKR